MTKRRQKAETFERCNKERASGEDLHLCSSFLEVTRQSSQGGVAGNETQTSDSRPQTFKELERKEGISRNRSSCRGRSPRIMI